KILHHLLKEVDPGASQNDALHPSCKWRETERDGLSTTHYLSFWLRYNRQTAMSSGIYRPHSEYHIILRNLQGCTRTAADRLDVLPIGRVRRAPDHFVGGRSGRRFPRQSRVVVQVLGQHLYACRRRWSRCQRGQGRRVQPRYVRHIVEVDKLRQVSIFDAIGFILANVLMLMVVIFAEFGEPHGGKALLIERIVVASAEEAVQPEDQKRLHSGIVGAPDVGDVAGKLARSRVALSAEHSNAPDFRLACRRRQ